MSTAKEDFMTSVLQPITLECEEASNDGQQQEPSRPQSQVSALSAMACTDVPSSPIREHTGQPEALAPYCGSLREPPQSGVPTRHNVPAGLPHHTVPAGEDEQDGPPSCSRAEAELLSDLDLELGRVQAAVRDAQEAVTLAIRRAESAGDNDDCAQAALCMVQSDLNEARMAVQAHREFSKETREILSPMPMVPPSVPAPQTATALARSIQLFPPWPRW